MSIYDFMVYWGIAPATYCTSKEAIKEQYQYHCKLTESGIAKLEEKGKGEAVDFVAGIDYKVKDKAPSGADWLPLPDNEHTAAYRHNWVFVRNRRPLDPSFLYCPMPRRGEGQQERNAALIMSYFHPFTLNPAEGSEDVPYLGDLQGQHRTWHTAMLHWFDGRVLSEESTRYITNFLVVTRSRPEDDT